MPAAAMPADHAPALTLSAADLARELRVSVKTITRMDQCGKMPAAVRVGHAKRWLRSTIVAWLADGCPSRREWEARHDARTGRGQCRQEV
jgi:predicted DNA-binding transcriptional regulator AlpA